MNTFINIVIVADADVKLLAQANSNGPTVVAASFKKGYNIIVILILSVPKLCHYGLNFPNPIGGFSPYFGNVYVVGLEAIFYFILN